MVIEYENAVNYILSFLLHNENTELVYYGKQFPQGSNYLIWIKQSDFFDVDVYGNEKCFPDSINTFEWEGKKIPFLFGKPFARKEENIIFFEADLVASAYVLLSRYQEYIFKDNRDNLGRFLAKNDLFFREGYCLEPIVDLYGSILTGELRKLGVSVLTENNGFENIYLTHDVDEPFKTPSFLMLIKEEVKTLISQKKVNGELISKFFDTQKDEYYTFDEMIKYDDLLKRLHNEKVKIIYFIITSKATLKNGYCSVGSVRFKKLIKKILDSGANIGIHISLEAGRNPSLVFLEVKRLPVKNKRKIMSRNHYLRWCDPGDCTQMINAGITDDFTMAYADSIGFRVGTCREYNFINPENGDVTSLTIHPLTIMDCVLDSEKYMDLEYNEALRISTEIIKQCYKYHGDLCLLWHNQSFSNGSYHKRLYFELIKMLVNIDCYEKTNI